MSINKLIDLNCYKTAPELDLNQSQNLSRELDTKIKNSDWLTIGIMAKSDIDAKNALRSIINKYHHAGEYFLQWDGADSQGIKMASGIYFYKIISDERIKTQKMIYLK